jgi:CHRD domain
MQRRRGPLAVIIGVISVATVFAFAATASAAKKKTYKLEASMTGAVEEPPGDPNGSGSADLKLVTRKGRPKGKVCFDITFRGIDDPVAAHIHKAPPGVAGPIVVPFFEGTAAFPSPIEDCVKAKRRLVNQIGKNPADFYVNLHNAAFPAGAVRGQLEKRGSGSTDGGGGGGGGPY